MMSNGSEVQELKNILFNAMLSGYENMGYAKNFHWATVNGKGTARCCADAVDAVGAMSLALQAQPADIVDQLAVCLGRNWNAARVIDYSDAAGTKEQNIERFRRLLVG